MARTSDAPSPEVGKIRATDSVIASMSVVPASAPATIRPASPNHACAARKSRSL